jgi:hypothetical protein
LAYRWRHCSIRQLPLQAPIVACGLGRLYSKEAVLEGLLDRSTLSESTSHIKNLKDVKNLNLTPNPAFDGDTAKNGGYIDDGRSPFICPVIGLEMNGKYKFCFLWNCGCVISERALKEIKTYVSPPFLVTHSFTPIILNHFYPLYISKLYIYIYVPYKCSLQNQLFYLHYSDNVSLAYATLPSKWSSSFYLLP